MSLPDSYIRYPKRRYGQDIDRYDWAPSRMRGRFADGARLGVSIVVPLELFMLNPSGKPFRHPGAMQTPYPDLRHYTTRDYGNRVGAFRILDALRAAGFKATFAANGALIGRVPPLIDRILADGHELAAHGWDTDHIHWSGVDAATEAAWIARTAEAFARRGLTPRSWMSPARQESVATPDLVRAAGFDIILDWESDTTPISMRTQSGALHAFPLLNELDDRMILTVKNHSEDDWRDQILEAARMMRAEADETGAQCFGFTLTPYIAGQPFRIRALREIFTGLAAIEGARIAPVRDLVDGWRAA